MVIDLEPLEALIGTSPAIPNNLDSDVIHDFADPFQIDHRPTGGADTAVNPGSIGGVTLNLAEKRVFATDEHDGTLMSATLKTVTGEKIKPQELFIIAEEIDSSDDKDLTIPGAIQVRPGDPDDQAADVFFLMGKPEGRLCAVDIEAGS